MDIKEILDELKQESQKLKEQIQQLQSRLYPTSKAETKHSSPETNPYLDIRSLSFYKKELVILSDTQLVIARLVEEAAEDKAIRIHLTDAISKALVSAQISLRALAVSYCDLPGIFTFHKRLSYSLAIRQDFAITDPPSLEKMAFFLRQLLREQGSSAYRAVSYLAEEPIHVNKLAKGCNPSTSMLFRQRSNQQVAPFEGKSFTLSKAP